MPARSSSVRCLGAFFVYMMAATNSAAAQGELLFDVGPIEVQLTASQRLILATPTPTALAHATYVDELVLSWESGRLGLSSDAMDAFRIDLAMLPTSSVAVDKAVVALLENWRGALEIMRGTVIERWIIRPANYQAQFGKINSFPDGRVIPLLPIELRLENSSRVAFGHLAVFCTQNESGPMRCHDLKFVFSEAAASSRNVDGTVEEVLANRAF